MAVKVGVATVNITPSVGFDNMGDYLRLTPAEGIGNELFAKAMVFDDGEKRVAIVTADIITFAGWLLGEVRERIESLTGINSENVLLSASHTHSSPAIGEKDDASREYLTELSKKIAGAVLMADQNKREVLIGCGVGEAKVAVNRWQRTKTGVQWGPNFNAPVDHDVMVMRVDNLDGQPMAILVNFASHPSILGGSNLLYSGDYVSYVQSGIEKAYDGEATAMFCTGAGGDIKIAVVTEDNSRFRYTNLEDCRINGTIIAAEAVKVVETIETKPAGKISAKITHADLPFVELPSVEEMEKVKNAIQQQLAELDAGSKQAVSRRMQLEWANTTLEALKNGTAPESFPAEVQLVRIGDEIAFFAVPGELFVEVGMRLKREMNLPGAFVVAYANGGIGYLPSRRAEEWGWCEHDDSYRLTPHPANFSGAIEDVLSETLAMMMGT